MLRGTTVAGLLVLAIGSGSAFQAPGVGQWRARGKGATHPLVVGRWGRPGTCLRTFRMEAAGKAEGGGADSLAAAFEKEAGKRVAGHFSTTLIRKRSGEGGEGENIGLNLDQHYKSPSALLPPHRAVQVQLEALQMNDYPEIDDGCRHAFRFAVRTGSEHYGSVGKPFLLREGKLDPSILEDRIYVDPEFEDRHYAKDWSSDRLLEEDQFVDMVHEHFAALLGMHKHRWGGLPVFNEEGTGCSMPVVVEDDEGREETYVFQLSKAGKGAYRDCWMTTRVYRV